MPIAASAGIADVLTDLFIVLLAAKLGDELFRRLRQPTLVGEILAGLLVGPAVFGLVEPSEVLEVFAELGVVFLLFWVGLETKLSDLREVGPTAISVGVLGVVIPFAGGIALGAALGESTATSLFIGAALTATSVGITSAVLIDLGVLERRTSRTILGAAIVDDIFALLLVAVAAGVAAEGGVDIGSIAVTAGDRRRVRRLHRPRRDAAARPAARAAARAALLGVPAAARRDHLPGPCRVRLADRPGRDHRRVPGRHDRRRDARPASDRGGGRAALRVLSAVLLRVHRPRDVACGVRRSRHRVPAGRRHGRSPS